MPAVVLSGREGRLEGYYETPPPDQVRGIALILHPSPEAGGSMNTRVTYRCFRLFAEAGFATLRFNFRGVGKSEGNIMEDKTGDGELSDASHALDWLQALNKKNDQCWICGFSFGSWIGTQLLMRRPEIKHFINIAPPVKLYDFSFLTPCPASGLFVAAENDRIAPLEAVENLTRNLRTKDSVTVETVVIAKAKHLFNENMPDLEKTLANYLKKHRPKISRLVS